MGIRFKVVVEKAEEGGYIVECPALPGCVSEGETIEEALENIKEAIQGCIRPYRARSINLALRGCIEARNAQIKTKGRKIEVFV
jgi:predicted RNase H-like HicB family nuclease